MVDGLLLLDQLDASQTIALEFSLLCLNLEGAAVIFGRTLASGFESLELLVFLQPVDYLSILKDIVEVYVSLALGSSEVRHRRAALILNFALFLKFLRELHPVLVCIHVKEFHRLFNSLWLIKILVVPTLCLHSMLILLLKVVHA